MVLLLGSHISLTKQRKYLEGVVRETAYNGGNVFMIFTGPPRNKKRVDVSEFFLEEAKKIGKKYNIFFENCVVHAPYIINLATHNEIDSQFNIDFLTTEAKRTAQMGIKYLVLHPGFHNNQTFKNGMNNLIKNLKIVLENIEKLNVFICLETMSGKKNQLGKTLEELQEIIKGCDNNPKLAVCIDTVHLHDAGYNMNNKEEFLEEFEKKIGLERIKVLHIGDSMNKRGSTKDRHANLGYGHIGFESLIEWFYDSRFKSLPLIVETPYWIFTDEKQNKILISPYKHEIECIKNKKWSPIPYPQYKPIFNIKNRVS